MRLPLVTRRAHDALATEHRALDEAYTGLVRYVATLESEITALRTQMASYKRQVLHYKATQDTGLIVGRPRWQDVVQ